MRMESARAEVRSVGGMASRIPAAEEREAAKNMFAGMRNWKIVASSEGRKVERMSPVWEATGLPRPLFQVVSDPRVVWPVIV